MFIEFTGINVYSIMYVYGYVHPAGVLQSDPCRQIVCRNVTECFQLQLKGGSVC